MTNTDALTDLVRSWLALRIALTDETSSNIAAAYPDAIEKAKAHAEAVGLAWSSDLVPEFVQDKLDYHRLCSYVLHVPETGIWYDRNLATASWWDKYELQPGDYPVEFVNIDYKPVPKKGSTGYYAQIVVDAVLLESYRVSSLLQHSLAKHENHHEKTTVSFHPYNYQITDGDWRLWQDGKVLGTVRKTY